MDSSLLPLFSIPPFIVSFSMVTMGVIFLLKNPRVKLHRLFACCAGSLALWTFGYGLMYATADPTKGLFYARLGYIGVVFIPTFFVHFVLEFLNLHYSKVIAVVYTLSLVFLVISRLDVFLVKVHKYFWGFYPIAGPVYIYFVVFFYACCGACVYWLLNVYRELKRDHSSSLKLNQVKYVLAAFFIASLSLSDYLPNYYVEVYPFAYLVAFGWLVSIAYGTFKYRVMDINVIIRKTLVYSLVSAALASIYGGTVTLLAQGLGTHRGSPSAFSSALAAIFITLLFNPLRIRIQRWIDRHFPRERLDPELLQEAAGSFAHEMKRPLTKMSFPAQLALQDLEFLKSGEKTLEEVLPGLEQRLRFIVAQSIDAGRMIEAIRELSSSSTAPFVLVDLQTMLDSALGAEREQLEKYEVSVHVNLPSDLPKVSGQSMLLEIVFMNLIKNAREAMRDLPSGQKRELHVSGKHEGNQVVIRVKDSGPGMKSNDVAKVFDSHFSTKGAAGAGVGLYLCRQIIQNHVGSIEVHSSLGHGAEFVIRLPKAT